MSKYHFGSIVDRYFRNTLQRLADDAAAQGKAIQDLVAEGQLTPEQYSTLIQSVNGLVKKGELSVNDLNKNLGKLDATYFSSDFLAELNEGEVVATELLPESVTTDNLASSAVTYNKTNFIELGKNLFNKENVNINRTINSTTGTEIVSEYFDVYELEIQPNKEYTENHSFSVAEYDENGEFIRDSFLPHLSSYTNPRTFTTSVNARSIKIAIMKSRLDYFQIELGSSSTEYESYKLSLKYASSGIEDYLISPNEKWEVV